MEATWVKMDSDNDSAQRNMNIDKVVSFSSLRKLAQLSGDHEHEQRENAFWIKRTILAIVLALLYPLPAFNFLHFVFGEYMSWNYPYHKVAISLFLLSWLLVFLIPFFWKRPSEK